MDSGLIFTLGVAFGLLGGIGFILLLIGTDDYATSYFSAYWRRLGAPGAAINPEAQETVVNSKENVSQESSLDSGECPGASGSAPGILTLLLVVLLVGCAHGGVGGHVSPSVGGGVGDVHGATRSVRGVMPSSAPASEPSPTSPRTEDLPICGTEDPYLPDPCRIEITKGEWLRVSNAGPKKSQKHHSKWWWLLITLITF